MGLLLLAIFQDINLSEGAVVEKFTTAIAVIILLMTAFLCGSCIVWGVVEVWKAIGNV